MPVSSVVYVGGKQSLLRSLKQVLEPSYEVVAMADNALSLVDAISSLSPALVVMDIGGQSSESSIVRHIRHRFPDPVMLVLMEETDPVALREAETWGVQGVVARSRVTQDLCSIAASALKRGVPKGALMPVPYEPARRSAISASKTQSHTRGKSRSPRTQRK